VGSGRSIAGVLLGPAVIAMKEAGLLAAGGGHAMAAGFRVAAEGFPAFVSALEERLADEIAQATADRVLDIDAVLGPSGAYAAAAALGALAPFGQGNPAPRFALPAMRIRHIDILKDVHMRLRLEGGDGSRLDAMAFRAAGGPLGAFLNERRGAAAHLAGRIEHDTWRGRDAAKLIVEDAGDP